MRTLTHLDSSIAIKTKSILYKQDRSDTMVVMDPGTGVPKDTGVNVIVEVNENLAFKIRSLN